MEIESTLTRKTYVKHIILMSLRSVWLYALVGMAIIIVIISIIQKYFIPLIIPCAGILAVLLYNLIWLLYQCYWSKNNQYFFINKNYNFGEDEIVVEYLSRQWIYKWEAFQRWSKNAGCYVLYFKNGQAIIFPISDVPYYETAEFENILREKIDHTRFSKLQEKDKSSS